MTPRCLHIARNTWRKTTNHNDDVKVCGAVFEKHKAPERLDSTSLWETRIPKTRISTSMIYTVVQQLCGRVSKKVDRTYIGSLVQTHLSWDATSQSQSSLRSKSELVLLLNRRSRWCMQRTMWTALVSNTGWIDCIARQGTRECFINTARSVRQQIKKFIISMCT